jgi:hypothetical protein
LGRRSAAALLVVLVMGAACAPPSDGGSPPASIDASHAASGSVPVVRLQNAEPVEREEAAVDAAFDPDAAAALAGALPADLDWATTGILGLYLGRRADGGWRLAIQSASLIDGELRILARETRPVAGVDLPGPTFPADCASIDRTALPVGTLTAQADDTVSDEFIVDGDLHVPAP